MVDGKGLLDAIIAGVAQNGRPLQAVADGKSGDAIGNVLGQVQQGAGGLAGLAKQAFGQATAGVAEGAQKLDQATGASGKLDELLKQLTGGQSSGDLVNQAKELIKNNKVAAGTLAGVLGGLMLGTSSGRSLTWNAAKIGGLVLIGGLAYKAYQNHQQGKPMLGGEAASPQQAPAGSGFEPEAQSNDHALLYISAMIAAAAADGRVDDEEKRKIVGQLGQSGFTTDGTEYLTQAFNHPATIDDLVRQAPTPQVRAQVYTAARVAIDPDSDGEKSLARRTGAQAGSRG